MRPEEGQKHTLNATQKQTDFQTMKSTSEMAEGPSGQALNNKTVANNKD